MIRYKKKYLESYAIEGESPVFDISKHIYILSRVLWDP